MTVRYNTHKKITKVAVKFGVLLFSILMLGCASNGQKRDDELQIAFMPDVHFHDIYAEFSDGSFTGLPNSISGKNATIRTLSAELTSTRLFNENYFALLAALDDIVARGVKYVALPGDFSDDGQVIHLRGLQKILERYHTQQGLEFFVTLGNHDPKYPYRSPAGKSDYLGEGGHEQRIFSQGYQECTGYSDASATITTEAPLKTICSEDVVEMGYLGIMQQLQDYGFFPKASDLYWESPFSDYNTSSYSFAQAKAQATYDKRQYEICQQGAGGEYKKSNYSQCFQIPDASYLIEPVAGLWLLAIDANVYIPKANANEQTTDPRNYQPSSDAGYNRMFSHKPHVIKWIKDVVKRANAQGKKLLAFSHFPMDEFYDGENEEIGKLFGVNNFQLSRVPQQDINQALAATGLRLHVAGHMHMNDTGIQRYANGDFLFNIQAPSIAAYVPAYKLLTLKAEQNVEVETIVLDEVPRFDELFEHYQQEYEQLKSSNAEVIWNKDVLTSKNYREFTQWHLTELTRQRFLPKEWPEELRQMILSFSGSDMLILSQLHNNVLLTQLQARDYDLTTLKSSPAWQQARVQAAMLADAAHLTLDGFLWWNGFDLAQDFYRLRNAGQLALRDISDERLAQYSLLTQTLEKIAHQQRYTELAHNTIPTDTAGLGLIDVFIQRFAALFTIFQGFKDSHPDDHFMLNLSSGEVTDLSIRGKQH